MMRSLKTLTMVFFLVLVENHCCLGEQNENALRMINGKEVTDWKTWQFAVYFNFLQPKPLWKTCGGALISKQWVVTVAHCVEDILGKPKYLSLGIGRTSRISTSGPHNYSVSRIVAHPDFVTPAERKGFEDISIDSDIALLKLSKPVPAQFKPILLPDGNDDISNDKNAKCQSAGWGKISPLKNANEAIQNTYQVSEKLNSINVKLISKKACIKKDQIDKAKNAYFGQDRDLARILCADPSLADNNSGCIGDSGSPMICEKNGEQVLQGLMAGGDALCRLGKGAMYLTEVSKFTSWIKKTMKKY